MYHPEPYWNEVAKRVARRGDIKLIAGDDEPYYRYKRARFLGLFRRIGFKGKSVLEIGSGPGGNLAELVNMSAASIHGVDISDEMVAMSKKMLAGKNVQVAKIDGLHIPYPDRRFDICFTSTVLQHNTDEAMLAQLVKEICRVAKTEIYLFEKVEKKIKGTTLCMGRPVSFYESMLNQHGFELKETAFLNIEASFLFSGVIRKLFNKRGRKEGEPVSSVSRWLQNLGLPLTSVLDRLFPANRDLAMLRFSRKAVPFEGIEN
ncbi:MAG TPA: class I SAM-dependent methyltransferase [Flavisolibacter sp.]|nr:class I SAM-dependent methyltransferase [Flavisolibacter sp.]